METASTDSGFQRRRPGRDSGASAPRDIAPAAPKLAHNAGALASPEVKEYQETLTHLFETDKQAALEYQSANINRVNAIETQALDQMKDHLDDIAKTNPQLAREVTQKINAAARKGQDASPQEMQLAHALANGTTANDLAAIMNGEKEAPAIATAAPEQAPAAAAPSFANVASAAQSTAPEAKSNENHSLMESATGLVNAATSKFDEIMKANSAVFDQIRGALGGNHTAQEACVNTIECKAVASAPEQQQGSYLG